MEDKCWHKHKHLAPDWWKEAQANWRAQFNSNSKGKEVAHYHSLLTTWIEEINSHNQIILDSGASFHMFNSASFFIDLTPCSEDESISTGKEGAKLPIKEKGTVQLTWKDTSVKLSNAFFVPNLFVNLISPGELIVSKRCSLTSDGNQF